MRNEFYGKLFHIITKIARPFWGKMKIVNAENIRKRAVYVSHHQNQYGPFSTWLWFPEPVHMWSFHVFMEQKECYRQLMDYTLTVRLKIWRPIAALIAFPLSYFIPAFCRSAKVIPVYRKSFNVL